MDNKQITPQMKDFWDEKEEERNKRVVLEVITGGKDGGNILPWLLGLDEKTAFLVEEARSGANMPGYLLLQFFLVKKFSKAVLLVNSNQQEVFVNPGRFCSQFRLYEILYDPKTMPPIEVEKEEKEDDDHRDAVAGDGSKGPVDSSPVTEGRHPT